MLTVVAFALLAIACGRSGDAQSAESGLDELRRRGPTTAKASVAGRWLLAELVSPGGNPKHASRARKRLDEIGGGDMIAHLARGLDDAAHGRLRDAPGAYLEAVKAARVSDDPRAPLVAWFAAGEALGYRSYKTGLWDEWKPFVETAIAEPGRIGWRGRAELVEWWTDEAWSKATKNIEKVAAKKYGCIRNVRLAGPFGRGAAADAFRNFAAEAPGPWPLEWPRDADVGRPPKVIETSQEGCTVSSDEPTGNGIYYAESYLELDHPTRVLIAAQGSLAVWVNDHLVLERDPREWGIWPRFGVELGLDKGRHRVLVRLAEPVTILRVLHPDGRAYDVSTSADAAPGYSISPPSNPSDPNVLMRYIKNGDVVDPGDDLVRFVGAHLLHIEGQDDVAAVMVEPLAGDTKEATGPTLELAATLLAGDPIFSESDREDLVRRLDEAAAEKDPSLWQAQLSLAIADIKQKGPTEGVPRLRELTRLFPQVPAIQSALGSIYAQLGWTAEHDASIKDLAERFPEDTSWLYGAIDVYERAGDDKKVDEIIGRILELDPDSEVRLGRAIARQDYDAATGELKRLSARRPERKDFAERMHDVMVRAGNAAETWKKLEAAIKKDPESGRARFELADARFAAGDNKALRKSLVDAVEAGAPIGLLADAIDLVEGVSELEPFRLDAKKVIAEYEKSGVELPGTAARVLDYMAVWVRSDGSSRLLEHEVIRIQSKEAIDKFAEHSQLPGMVLHMRVIKKDGRTLEPLQVAGKPTVTFPHLEVGDYIETEQLMSRAGDGEHGLLYSGPHWFFREENVAYARSEFVLVSPSNKDLTIETRGNVPAPQIEKKGALTVHRWRVDDSPAAPAEPQSAPAQEFLPSVRIGWGITLPRRVRSLSDTFAYTTPIDPRIKRIARRYAKGPSKKPIDRARKLYRWVLANVEKGDESDGRRVITSKQGSLWRAFMELCRSADIPVDFALAKNRLASPPVGTLSKAAEFTEPVLRLGPHGKKGKPVWLTVSSKFAPFGYVPAEARGMPAYLLFGSGAPPKLSKTPADGVPDSIAYVGKVRLARDGSAEVDLELRFVGKYAMALRTALIELAERQLHDILESRLLGRALRGAQLRSFDLRKLDDPDVPLVIEMKASVSTFAQVSGGTLIIVPPFTPRISQLAALPSRETPLLIGDASHQEVQLEIELPEGARVETNMTPARVTYGEGFVDVKDAVSAGKLTLDRRLELPAGRVQPDEYAKFAAFAREADALLARSIRVLAK